jgi:glycosyltransferase involved in cell wall biosynthesis
VADPRDVFVVCNNLNELGGLNTWAHHLGRLLAGRGHRAHLVGITSMPNGHDYGTSLPYETTVLQHGVPPRPGRRGSRAERRRLAAYARATAKLTEVFSTARPGGVVIAAQVWAMEWVIGADTGVMPVLGMSHESYEATRSSSRYARVKRYFADVDRFLTLTQDDADAWARDGMGNADFMPNFLHVSPQAHADLEAPVVVRLGRLAHEKGQDMLIHAWSRLADAHPEWRLRLFGSGPEEAALRALAVERGVAASVEFPGPTPDVSGALLGGSVFALSSREEGFPMSIMEAMAHGLPCVAFDCAPGVRELITDGVDGFLVAPGNVIAFAQALERLMVDRELRSKFGRCAQESVLRFAPERIAGRWEELFDLLDR